MTNSNSIRLRHYAPFFVLCLSLHSLFATNVYVDSTASGSADGSSWVNADTTLQDALTGIVSGDTIFVAQGTYYPDEGGGQTNNNRNATFTIPDGVVILGGFPSGGGVLSSREFYLYATTLSGDIDQVAGPANNSIHIISTGAVSSAMTLDGFYVVDGNSTSNFGGGWLNSGSPTVKNCFFINNQAASGAAMYNNATTSGISSPTYINCRFDNNSASNTGGAIVNYGEGTNSSPLFVNCVFTNNSASFGGGLYNDAFYGGMSSPEFINCTFSNNSASSSGSVMANAGVFGTSNISLDNCILWNNGALPFWQDEATTTVNYCVFEGTFPFGVSGANNIFTDPFFVSSTDLQLTICSPAINMADSSQLPVGIATDLLGNDRIIGSEVDMGAYEFKYSLGPTIKLYVDSTVQNGDGLTWATAFSHLQDALTIACLSQGDSVLVAQGTYYPDDGMGQTPGDQDASFHIPSGVAMLGGFPTGGGNISNRDFTLNKTILSGDIDQSPDSLQNAFHVIKTYNVAASTITDGFFIVDGFANDSTEAGGGWYNVSEGPNNSNPTINNCLFFNNTSVSFGGALYSQSDGGQCEVFMTNCDFENNASQFGGAIYSHAKNDNGTNPYLTNCGFINNTAEKGGAVFTEVTSGGNHPWFSQCVFIGNIADSAGGALYNLSRGSIDHRFYNCSFHGNSAPSGGAIHNATLTGPIITRFANTIVWGNGITPVDYSGPANKITSAYYSLYEGPFPANTDTNATNLHVDPLFHGPSDLRLRPCSPAINTATNGYLAIVPSTDFDGNPRIVESTVDMGAYEYQSLIINQEVFYVDSTINNGDGKSWVTAFSKLQDALYSGCLDAGDTIFIAQGNYFPDEGAFVTEDDRKATFHIPSGVVLLGGFPSGGSDLINRDFELNTTTLNGNIDQSADSLNNSFHVVTTSDVDSTTVVDGIFISNGNANESSGPFINRFGGGWLNHIDQVGAVGNPTIRNCTFHNNSAESTGGAMYNYGDLGEAAPTYTNCRFINNFARRAGAVYNRAGDLASSPSFTDCHFLFNHSQFSAGAVHNNGDGGECSPLFDNCVFSSNSTSDGEGGAMVNSSDDGDCSPIIKDCQFIDNITNTDNTSFSSAHGGAIFNELEYEALCAPLIQNCLFIRNKANRADGGAIYNYGYNEIGLCAPKIIHCQFDSNQADNGGAIYNYAEDGTCKVTIENSIFRANKANDEGGAIFNFGENEACVVDITSSSFSDNIADYGYAIYNNADDTDYCILSLTNSIVWHYEEEDDHIENDGDARMIAVRNVYQGEYPDDTDSMGITSIYMNPAFVSPLDLRLLPCSPAIDAGINDSIPAGITMDLDSNTRIYNGTVDIGAYEFQSAAEDPTTLYVDAAAVFGGNGFTWATAFNKLQNALQNGCLQDGDTILVAEGTYYPDEGYYQEEDNQYEPFEIPSGVTLLGGFPTGGGSMADRDYVVNQTILSGNIDQTSDSLNNSTRVVEISNASPSTQIDGFYIEDGRGRNHSRGGGLYNRSSGDGVLSNPTIKNTIFRNNFAEEGGAIYSTAGFGREASPRLYNCTFINNKSFTGGALMLSNNGTSKPVIESCRFINNMADLTRGGALVFRSMGSDTTSGTIVNCLFLDNFAAEAAGAIYNYGENGLCTPTFINCSFSGNDAPIGGAIYNSKLNGTCAPVISNSIIWNNGLDPMRNDTATSRLSHSILQGAIPNGTVDAGGNLNLDPFFVSSTDLRLTPCSPGINAGSNDSIPPFITTDINKNNRIFNVDVDMGAYELQSVITGDITTLYVDSSSISGVGESWSQAYNYLQDALNSPCLDAGDTIVIAQGTYYPDDGDGQIDNDRSMTFNIPSGIVVLGGFPSGGSSLSNRIYYNYKTVLSGDVDQNDSLELNSYHVVSTTNVSDSTRIDGLYIRGGNATTSPQYGGGWYNVSDGAGMSSKPVISDCIFEDNSADFGGGGLHNYSIYNGESSPELINCTFQHNNSNLWGGAVSNQIAVGSCYAKFSRCTFRSNQAVSGGAVYNAGKDQMSPSFLHCLFEGNSAASNSIGGAVSNNGGSGNSTLLFGNCVFKGNFAGRGAALYNTAGNSIHKTINIINCSFSGNRATMLGSALTNTGDTAAIEVVVTNSVFWGNSISAITVGNPNICKISHSVLQEIPDPRIALSGYISYEDPLFKDEPDFNNAPAIGGDLDIFYGSSALNHGLNSFLPPEITVDFNNNDRIINSTVDIGAYEFDYEFHCGEYATLTIDDIPIVNGTYRAIGLLSSTGEVNPSSMGRVIYKSENSIELNGGFEVKLGEQFDAIIEDPCID